MTATTANKSHLIQKFNGQVNLCVSRNNQWVLIYRGITLQMAADYGFDVSSPRVKAIFAA
jgi:hypothetical protein